MGSESLKRTFRNLPLAIRKKLKMGSFDEYVKTYYEYYTGKKLDLNNPVEFNQKIQWLKVYYQPEILHELVDKYAVRSFVSKRVGDQYLNTLLGVYDHGDQVNFDKLPERFVIKGAHGCHYNLIVRDKSKLNMAEAKRKFKKWLSRDYFKISGGEWAYKDVPRRLVAEAYMQQADQDILNDYKFFCFNGVPKFAQIDLERNVDNYRCYYDTEWNKLPFWTERNQYYEPEVARPKCLEEMVDVARRLSQGFPFVRVDLYDVNDQVVFGEMTFYPADGRKEFIPEENNKKIGDMLELPKIPAGQSRITSFTE